MAQEMIRGRYRPIIGFVWVEEDRQEWLTWTTTATDSYGVIYRLDEPPRTWIYARRDRPEEPLKSAKAEA